MIRQTARAAGLGLILVAIGACGDGQFGPPVWPTVQPLCSNSAPLLGEPDPRAPRFIVYFNAGVDPDQETARLAGAYGFTPTYIYHLVPGFAAVLAPEIVARLRCESSVREIHYDAIGSTP